MRQISTERVSIIAVRLRNVDFSWPGDSFRLRVPDFTVGSGETVFLLGRSGSGKSTLLNLICGALSPQLGTIEVEGQELGVLTSAERDRFRADNIGVIFQMFNLLPYATGLENVLLALRFAPSRRRRCRAARAEALELLRELGLSGDSVTEYPASTLSVGQQQRVAVARAMIGQPSLIIADEPTSSLDASSQADFLDRLFAQVRDAGSTLVMVSHDERLAARFDRVVELGDICETERDQTS